MAQGHFCTRYPELANFCTEELLLCLCYELVSGTLALHGRLHLEKTDAATS